MKLVRTAVVAAAVALLGLGLLGTTTEASTTPAVISRDVAANANDPGIDASRGPHAIWLAADPHRRMGRLLVFMAGGGATNFPQDWKKLGAEAALLGYHTIVLAYKNELPLTNAAACGPGEEPPASPPDCALNARLGDPRRAGSLAARDRQRQPGEQHREPADESARAPGGDVSGRGVVVVPRHERRGAGAELARDRRHGRLPRRGSGGSDRDAAPGPPRRAPSRVGRTRSTAGRWSRRTTRRRPRRGSSR